MTDKKKLPIRNIVHKADSGDIKASFQLYDFYKNGKYIEKDEAIAQEYALKTIEIFNKKSLRISKIKLTDYRGFVSEELELSRDNITVISGVNGAGKTALLDAIQKSLSWLIRRIVSQGGNGELVELGDIRVSTEYASIITQLSIEKGVHFNFELSKTIEGSNLSRKNSLQEINLLAEIYKLANSQDVDYNFPLMAFYSVDRLRGISSKDINYFEQVDTEKIKSKFSAYTNSLNGIADFKLFFKWFKDIDDINNAEAAVHDGKNTGTKRVIEVVTKAIYSFLPEFSNLRVQRQPTLDMIVEKNGIALSVRQLSQGEKSLFALVADISRRLVLLNPSLENPLNGSGIVLIDEIDLHLHPAWQQKVIPCLTKTFPELQIIITTHSPQVLSTVASQSVRLLNMGRFYSAPEGTKGAKSSRLLKRLLGVDPRPVDDENAIMLKEYERLVYDDRWGSSEAKHLRKQLDSIYLNEEPKLTELDLHIENRAWEIDLEED
jgi:predicted ATP-binding protein involved in virulence